MSSVKNAPVSILISYAVLYKTTLVNKWTEQKKWEWSYKFLVGFV